MLNIHRDEVVIEQPQNEPIDVTPDIESSPEPPSSVVLEPEAKRPKECWQGENLRAREAMSEHLEREQRLALGIKSR